MHSLTAAVQAAFAPQGLLSRAEAQFLPREGQTRMALAVAQAIEERQTLVVEAGTGVGKTYAYLVPALLSGQRVLVSTATRALQDQLFARDLPRLVAALGMPLRMARLKGRSAYLCLERLERVRQGRTAPQDPQVLRSVALVERWARTTRTGDLGELPALDERSPALPLVTSTRDNCLGSDCPHWQDCHVNVARRTALDADVVVINHHLMFADLDVRDSGVAQLLPSAGVVVVDEAHQLNDTGVQFAGLSLSGQQLTGYARDVLRAGQELARGMADWMMLSARVEQALRELRLAAGKPPVGGRLYWQGVTPQGLDAQSWRTALVTLGRSLRALVEPLVQLQVSDPELRRLLERGSELLRRLATFAAAAVQDTVRWLELGSQQMRMLESPLTIAHIMRTRLLGPTQEQEHQEGSGQDAEPQENAPTAPYEPPAGTAWIFTSATLGDDERLSWFTEPCGLREAQVLRVDSPFDYARQAALYVPRPFAEAGSTAHSAEVARLALDAAQRLGGRTLVLTTTLRALHAIGDTLQQSLGLFGELDVLVQGQAPKLTLIERFVAAGEGKGASAGRGCILVASATFWEGVDLPGDALQLVVIDKLPFPPPDDPLVEARSRSLESVGRQAFADYMLPEAAMALKQGAGRLIRRETDRGVLVVCDPRLTAKGYGRRLRAALPPMRTLEDEAAFVQALQALAQPAPQVTTVSTTTSALP
ncbi:MULTISPECIES: ATP-dependent DNA helicase [Delftia]|uniref:ATP-dependent DNA helicase n=1 Tax=Delftia TaxID=80865 RepID=UPI00092C230F|nr:MULTISPECIES: ATP-dependent DNA helicase [Delftia]MDH0419897.1 ATP-dependent DNA helicase [Delftia tsuruhatensis]OJX10091.1 MAG: helicase [Delftia sp. 67-8]QFS65755.1 ATP-dependent DNA helicase [Delftia tsuruhatensis]WON87328.1 ATP-dependent DNA helicase [Delftia sp. UGAL515B_04]